MGVDSVKAGTAGLRVKEEQEAPAESRTGAKTLKVINSMECYSSQFSVLVLFLQVKEELKMENQRLKDENGALIRVITKLSK